MEQIILNLVPGGVSPVCYVSQYDVGRKIRLHLRNGSDPYVLSGAETVTATIRKASGEELIYDIANTSASYVDLIVNYDATDVIGESVCELIITESGLRIGSANFKMRIDPDVYSGDQKLEVVSATSENPDLSFETNVEENLLKLKAGFSPVQDLHGYDSPWIDSNVVNKKPYLMRAIAGTASRIGTHEYNKIIGGTVAFNQLCPIPTNSNTQTLNSVTMTDNRDGSYTFGGTATADCIFQVMSQKTWQAHKYILVGGASNGSTTKYSLAMRGAGGDCFDFGNGNVWDATGNTWKGIVIYIKNGQNSDGLTFKPQLIDITAMFGSTIADYIYSLEQATAGAGVAWFKALFPKDYYAYNAGELISVKTSEHITRGFNQWDEEWETGAISSTGDIDNSLTNRRTTSFIPVTGNTVLYYACPDTALMGRFAFYDANKELLYFNGNGPSTHTINVIEGARYLRITLGVNYGTTYGHNICVNISGPRDGEYEPYKEHSYPLDGDLELRGIPKLDANNNLYYDGDEYASDGGVNRRYGIVDLSSIQWQKANTSTFYTEPNEIPAKFATAWNLVYDTYRCPKYQPATPDDVAYMNVDKSIALNPQKRIMVNDTAFTNSTSAEFKAAMSGVYLLYEKAAETSETADPFTNPQEIDHNGSEEFVDNRSVAIPVGHESYYANICEIEGWNEVNVIGCGVNLWGHADVTIGSATYVINNEDIYLPAGTYAFQLKFSGTTSAISGRIDDADGNQIATFGGTISSGLNIKNITIPTGKTGVKFKLYSQGIGTYSDFEFSIGSEAPEYTPYNGQLINLDWNTNQWDEEWEVGGIDDITGNNYAKSDRIRSKNYIPIKESEIYYLSMPSNGLWIYCYDTNKTYISSRFVRYANNTFVPQKNAAYIRFEVFAEYGTTYNHDISINYPSTDHAYHPYRGHGVAYKGEVVYKDGGWKLKLLSKEFDLGLLNWGIYDSDKFYTTISDLKVPTTTAERATGMICSIFKPSSSLSVGEMDNYSFLRFNQSENFWVRDTAYSDAAKFKTAMNGIKLVYELATPIEIPLDQNSKLATVLGINNLMHDANGGTEVKFFRMISAS